MRVAKIFIAMLVALVALLVVATMATWAPDRPVDALKARWAPPPSVFLPLAGMQVHLRDEGPRDDPHPIVLLHGTSSSLHTWDGWAQALRSKHRVVRFDLPGFGLTGPFSDDNYRVSHYLRFVKALLDKLHLSHVIIAGNSFGGQIAWELAASAPERVDGLILVDAAGYAPSATSIPIGFRLARSPWVGVLAEHVLPRSIITSSTKNVYGDPSKVTPELVDRYYELTLRAGNRRALALRFKHVPAGEDAESIRMVRAPTLILWGSEDHLIPQANAETFHHDIAGSRMVVFDGLGHVPHEEDPGRTVEVVTEFLASSL